MKIAASPEERARNRRLVRLWGVGTAAFVAVSLWSTFSFAGTSKPATELTPAPAAAVVASDAVQPSEADPGCGCAEACLVAH